MKSKQEFCAEAKLTHTVLADVGGKTASAYGVLNPNGYAKRVTFYIAPSGTVAAVDEKVRVPSAAEDSLATLTRLRQEGGATAASSVSTPLGGSAPAVLKPGGNNRRLRGPADTLVVMDHFVADFGLPDVQTGRTRALTTLQAGKKATVIVFLSTTCPVSNAYAARLKQLAEKYRAQGVAFVGINANAGETRAQAAAHALRHGLTFPLLKDDGNIIADRFQATRTPEVFVLDRNSTLVYHGAIDDAQAPAKVTKRYVEATLDTLLAGQPVATKTTPVVGGEIKRATK